MMKLNYRPEIDGLRAVSVIAVILFHAEFSSASITPFILTGGFLGVDIFFVISGYLITLNILKGLSQSKFSFLDFYDRRARRILPTLFAVIIASIPFAWMFMLPKAVREFSGSVLSSLFFSSNY